jgi:protein SCO1/2
MDRRLILGGIVLLAVLSLAAGVLLVTKKPSFHGSVIDPPAPAAEITLTDSNNQPFTLSGQRGKVVLLYFGYTNCPDECPLTMAKLKQTFDILGNASSNVQVLMVTTDPARDHPAQLKTYVTQFNPAFLGLTGTPDELQQVYKDYGVDVESNGETHTTFLYVIDQKGNLRLTFIGPQMNPQDVADDVQTLLKGN